MIVSSNVWSVREIRFSGRSELITFTCWIKMGEVGKKDEFLPIRYDVEALFKFLGNKVDGNYTASLDYKSIERFGRKRRKSIICRNHSPCSAIRMPIKQMRPRSACYAPSL